MSSLKASGAIVSSSWADRHLTALSLIMIFLLLTASMQLLSLPHVTDHTKAEVGFIENIEGSEKTDEGSGSRAEIRQLGVTTVVRHIAW
jgi:hypothetical protein